MDNERHVLENRKTDNDQLSVINDEFLPIIDTNGKINRKNWIVHNKTINFKIVNELVSCKKVFPAPLVTVKICRKCDFFKGIHIASEANNNLPPVVDIVCAWPTHRRVFFQIEEDNNNGSDI
jgi:hypothetical protein